VADTQKENRDRLARLKARDPGDMNIDLDDFPPTKKPKAEEKPVKTAEPEKTEAPESLEMGKFESIDIEPGKFDDLKLDLKIPRLGLLIASRGESERQLDPKGVESKVAKGEPAFDPDEVMQLHAEDMGITLDEFKKAAQAQSVPLANLFSEIGDKGRPAKKVVDEFKTQEQIWTLSPKQREVMARGEKIRVKGIKRVASREKKMSEKERKETLIKLLSGKDPRLKSRIFSGDSDSGEAEDAIAKPGQAEYAQMEIAANQLINPEIATDKEQAEIYKRHIDALGPPTTGAMIRNTLGERKFQALVSEIMAHKLGKMAEREGVGVGSKEYEQLKPKAERDSLYEVALLRTVNKYYLPGFIQYDQIDPGNVRNAPESKDKWWITQAMENAANVRIEVVGIDPKGIPVYRLTSPTWHIFEMADTFQAGIAGAAERVLDDSKDESLLTAIREGSLDGIKNRRDFLKAALSSEAAESGGLASVAMGSAGLVAAILTPDLFMGAAGVARSTKRVAEVAAATAGFRRMAPNLVESLGDGATNLAKTEDVLEAAEKAVARGDYDEALDILEEAKAFANKADDAFSETRKTNVDIAREVDRLDADIARRIGKRVKETTFTEGKRLAANVPGTFGETAQNIHMGARRVMLRGESVDQLTGFPELMRAEGVLDDLIESVELLKSGDIDKAFTARIREFAGKPFADDALALLGKFDMNLSDEGLNVAQRQSLFDFVGFLESPKATRLLRDNPSEWTEEVSRLARAIEFVDPEQGVKFLKTLDAKFPKTVSAAAKAAKETQKISLESARNATSRAVSAVRANFESRAASAAFVRERVAEQAKVAAEPLLVKLTDRYQAIGRDRLSPEALDFRDQIVDIYPALEGDGALKIVRLMDQEAKKFADSKAGRTVQDYYRERFAGVKRVADEVEEVAPKKAPTPDAPAPDAPTPKAPETVEPEPLPDLLSVITSDPKVAKKLPPGIRKALENARLGTDVSRGAFRGSLAGVPKAKPLPDVADEFKALKSLDAQTAQAQPMVHQFRVDSTSGLKPEVLYNHLIGMKSGDEVVEFLANHAKLDSTRLLAQRILPTIRRDPPSFEIVPGPVGPRGVASGLYETVDHGVQVTGAVKPARFGDVVPATGLTEEVLIHEFIHAATHQFILKNPSDKSVLAMQDLIAETRVGIARLIETVSMDKNAVSSLRSVKLYAENFDSYIGNPSEFLAFTLMDPKFQRLLSLIEVTPKVSLWNKFTRTVASIFGIRKENETNALAQALVASERVIQRAVKFDTRPAANAEPVVRNIPSEGPPTSSQIDAFTGDALFARNEVFITSPKLQGFEGNGITAVVDDLGNVLGTRFATRGTDAPQLPGRIGSVGLDPTVSAAADIRRAPVPGIAFTRQTQNPVLRIVSAEIEARFRNRGFGVDLYLRALKYAQDSGVGFVSDIGPSIDSLRVYKSLGDMGIPFQKIPRRTASGEYADAFFLNPVSLAKIDLDDLARQHGLRNRRSMFSVEMDESAAFMRRLEDGSEPLMVEFLENGQAIIRAMSETASVDDFIRALGQISRRDLDESGMKTLVSWLETKGINVGYQGARFTAADATEIERAEEEFARAFAAYVASGRADKPELAGPLSKVREWTADKYAAMRGAEVDGASLDMDESLRRSLDGLLRVPSKRVGLPNIIGIAKDALIKPDLGGTEVDILEEIARESFRMGTPISKADLRDQFSNALKAYNAGRVDEAVIRLPGPVTIKGWTANAATGKREFTLDELANYQMSLETAKQLELQGARKLGIRGPEEAIEELTPSELVDQWVVQNPIQRAARFMYLGGDAFDDMRFLPPPIRDAVMAGARRVQQAIGDAVTLVAEKDIVNLTRLVTGVPNVQFSKGGRSAMSAGHDSMASVSANLTRYFSSIPAADMSLIQQFMIRIRHVGSTSKVASEYVKSEEGAKTLGQISEIFHEIIDGPKASRFVSEAFKAAGYKGQRIDPKFFTQPAEGLDPGGLLEILMYYSNMTVRGDPALPETQKLWSVTTEGLSPRSTSQNAFNGIYQDINKFFADDPTVANRIAILIAGHGMADAAKKNWVKLGIAADEDLAKSMRQYIVGEAINPDDVVRVRNAFDSLGYNPNMVEGYNLDGLKLYVPKAARLRLDTALAQAQDPALLKLEGMNTMEALNSIAAVPEKIMGGSGTNSSAALSFALFYRYLKTRMVRGHFVLKSRYFWMNTFDHFNQVATKAGFRTALISSTRLFTQNVLSNPVGQAAVFAARSTGKGDSVEAFRRVLQNGGDAAAQWAGKLTRGSKWNVNVNPILEGAGGIVMIAGKPYKNNELRQIALEAGLFASFDTTQLGTKIQNVGNLFLQTQAKNGRLTQMGKDILGDIKGASEDIAEAWAERERLGCMVTLMEAGIDPRTAAKISIRALYDYAGSMSKADRNFLLNIFFPFWAFQKNANRQIFDTIFSPEGAYRLGVMRRAYDKGSELLSYLTYSASVDEYGISTDSLPPELRHTYFAFKKQLLDQYGENGKIPAPIQEEIRLFVSHSMIGISGGKVMQGSLYYDGFKDIAASLKGEDGETVGLDRRTLAAYYMPRPDRSGLPTYFRDRISVALPYYPEPYKEEPVTYEPPEEFQQSTKLWNDLYRENRPEAPYMAFFMPETTYAAAFNHFSYLFATKLLVLQKIEDMGDNWFTDEDDGSDAITPLTPLNALLNPARAPVLSDVQASLGTGGATIPKKIAPSLVHFFDYHMIDLLELDENDDTFEIQIEQEIAVEEGFEPEDFTRKQPGVAVKPGKRYYMMPGVAQLLFANSPLGELNDILLRAEKSSAEKAAGTRGELQKWARVISGLDQREILRERTTASEVFRAEAGTSGKTLERAKKKR